MPQSLPPAADLLAAAREFLETDLLPTLSGRNRFQTRVTINVLAQVQRELEQGAAIDDGESQRLRALLDLNDGDFTALNRELARRIREGEISWQDDSPRAGELIGHLRQAMGDALRINNPRWMKE